MLRELEEWHFILASCFSATILVLVHPCQSVQETEQVSILDWVSGSISASALAGYPKQNSNLIYWIPRPPPPIFPCHLTLRVPSSQWELKPSSIPPLSRISPLLLSGGGWKEKVQGYQGQGRALSYNGSPIHWLVPVMLSDLPSLTEGSLLYSLKKGYHCSCLHR